MLTAIISLGLLWAATDAGPAQSAGMERLSASATLALCLHREADDATRCLGEYTNACIRLSPEGETNAGMIGCTAEEHRAWEGVLATEYRALMEQRGSGPGDALRRSREAWIAARDADCAFSASRFEGGSHAPLEHVSCLRDKTAERVSQLQRWRDDFPPD